MGRGHGREDLRRCFAQIRRIIPEAVVRTTLITGFPGEGEADFNILLDFIQEIGFDHLGVFTYSDGEDLPAHRLPEPVDPALAAERRNLLMALQQSISRRRLGRWLDRRLAVLIEESPEAGPALGRTMGQAPEVDGVTRVEPGPAAERPAAGQIVEVRVTRVAAYDLYGELR